MGSCLFIYSLINGNLIILRKVAMNVLIKIFNHIISLKVAIFLIKSSHAFFIKSSQLCYFHLDMIVSMFFL